jgi:hypothetical protein
MAFTASVGDLENMNRAHLTARVCYWRRTVKQLFEGRDFYKDVPLECPRGRKEIKRQILAGRQPGRTQAWLDLFHK